jgi:hypothetical protein
MANASPTPPTTPRGQIIRPNNVLAQGPTPVRRRVAVRTNVHRGRPNTESAIKRVLFPPINGK